MSVPHACTERFECERVNVVANRVKQVAQVSHARLGDRAAGLGIRARARAETNRGRASTSVRRFFGNRPQRFPPRDALGLGRVVVALLAAGPVCIVARQCRGTNQRLSGRMSCRCRCRRFPSEGRALFRLGVDRPRLTLIDASQRGRERAIAERRRFCSDESAKREGWKTA